MYYNPVYGRLLIAFGVLFTIIFVLGFAIADMAESLAYCLLTGLMIIIGYNIQQGPYATYNENGITLYNFRFKEREHYQFKDKSQITVNKDLFYLNGKKLKMNKWFIKKSDWNRMVQYYSSSDESLLTELKD